MCMPSDAAGLAMGLKIRLPCEVARSSRWPGRGWRCACGGDGLKSTRGEQERVQ